MAWNNKKVCFEPPLLPPCRPSALGRNIIDQINTAPDDTVRAVLLHLTADYDQRFIIENLISKLPLDESELQTPEDRSSKKRKAETQTPKDHSPKKRKATPKLEICLNCEEVFEEGDTSESCRYHVAMQFDPDAPYWETLGPGYLVEDRPINRKVHKRGYWFGCCCKPGLYYRLGCRFGRHRAADGKRQKDLYGWKSYDEFRNAMVVPKQKEMASWEAKCIALRREASEALESDSDAEESDSDPSTEESDSTPATEESDSTPATEELAAKKATTQRPDVYDTKGEDDHGEEEYSWVDEYDKDGQDFPDFMQLLQKKLLAALRAQEIAIREAFTTREAFEAQQPQLGPLWPSQTLMVEKPTMESCTSGRDSNGLKRKREQSPGTERRQRKRIDQGQAGSAR
ncbi:hypothetical protein B0H65DRAFT_566516 [Neurospora tetraspora]|uniref:Uncharacterized protein n=1 Tax=Neurospora tetraspora TaxID=94610 RepID=A0AAE0J004_9PEZI|nr:hypothetical protein B0H65DRAFT_566516 [Neurospora tetraspora]